MPNTYKIILIGLSIMTLIAFCPPPYSQVKVVGSSVKEIEWKEAWRQMVLVKATLEYEIDQLVYVSKFYNNSPKYVSKRICEQCGYIRESMREIKLHPFQARVHELLLSPLIDVELYSSRKDKVDDKIERLVMSFKEFKEWMKGESHSYRFERFKQRLFNGSA